VTYVNFSHALYAMKSVAIDRVKETFSVSPGVDPPLMMETRIMNKTMDTSFIANAEFVILVSYKHSLWDT
jgi:hypothetical protein